MAFDQTTRNRLATFVKKARDLITDEFTQKFAERFGIADDGTCAPLEKLTHLDEPGLATAALLRQRIDYLVNSHPEEREGRAAAVKRLAREQAFTVLNRLAALRMAEKRGLILESVGKGYQSKGYKLYATVAGTGLGETYERYRRYLFCLCDELAVDLGALFDRHSPHGILFPREPALLGLLDLLNAADLENLWAEDETIGWIYQYYNDEAERKKMRKDSPAPRNSRELAVRNQFFTPRYVVEFLTDNTLGRIWYEMTQGETSLRERCRYLVRRPNEIFLKAGEASPEAASADGLSQEELLGAPVHIPHRPLKEPRELRMLDPACGSMHFGLYAFDLYEVIYAEAWDRGCDTLKKDFPDRAALLREVPRLVVENNIHGVDIDPRAAQIAALSLWLRAQKSWSQQGLAAAARPRITRSHIVCAEPMPGDKALLADFVANAFPAAERPVFQHLLERVFDHMQLAGEAGSLLKIEEEIRTAIEEARALWEKSRAVSRELFSTEVINTTLRPGTQQELGGLEAAVSQLGAKADFWESAEERIYQALRGYSEQAETTGSVQRRLFANDAAQGFAFIDLCRRRYDVAVMNPPFGLSQGKLYEYLNSNYTDAFIDLLASFVVRGRALTPGGFLGAITSRACLYTKTLLDWRTRNLSGRISVLADLGSGVLDGAMVEAGAYVLPDSAAPDGAFFDAKKSTDKAGNLLAAAQYFSKGNVSGLPKFIRAAGFFALIPEHRILYALPHSFWSRVLSLPRIEPRKATIRAGLTTYDDVRFLRLRWEVMHAEVGAEKTWMLISKGGPFSTFYNDVHLVVLWAEAGKEVGAYNTMHYGTDAQSRRGSSFYCRPAATYSRRTHSFSARALPTNCFFSDKGPAILPLDDVSPKYALGLFNADLFRGLIHIQAQFGCFETGILKLLPWAQPTQEAAKCVEDLAHGCWLAKADFFRCDETDAIFISPIRDPQPKLSSLVVSAKNRAITANEVASHKASEVSQQVAEIFGLSTIGFEDLDVFPADHVIKESSEVLESDSYFISTLVSYLLGVVIGRWDIRYVTGERPAPELPDPFAPLPVCPPGMLQGDDGLPLSPEAGRKLRAAGQYPLDVAWGGILVDDPEHPLDLVSRVQAALAVIWKGRAEAIEHEACELLGVATLRNWFRKPSGFFADHLKRYSKSRRQAPIYWPLSTKSGTYTLWIYYHRLSDQTLHTAIADFVEPKIKAVEATLASVVRR